MTGLTDPQKSDELKKLKKLAGKGHDALMLTERAGRLRLGRVESLATLAPFYTPPSSNSLEGLEKWFGKKAARKAMGENMGRAYDRGARAAVDDAAPLSDAERLYRLNQLTDEHVLRVKAKKAGDQRLAEEVAEGLGAEKYVDVTALGDDIAPPTATAGMRRDDGVLMLVAREWNAHNGHPGAFKSGLAALHAQETLQRGGRVQWYDVDGNTPQAVVSRLLSAGIPLDVLRDPDRFRLTINASSAVLLDTVADAADWLGENDLVVMDAAGGLVAAFGGDSNSADDWMRIYQSLLSPLVATGAAGLLTDHYAKTAAGTGYATGTGAKLKSLHGIVYAVEAWKSEPPRPESVGKVSLSLVKDTHGATGYGIGDIVAVLELDSRDAAHGPWSWRLMPGRPKDQREDEQAGADADYVLSLDPFPSSRSTLQAAIRAAQGSGWSNIRASQALSAARDRRDAAAVTLNPATFERTEKD